MNSLSFLLRMLRRDARAGELHLLVAALVVAVAALTAVGFFTDRVRQALALEANQLLGADMLLAADRPWPSTKADEARQRGLAVAETRIVPEHGHARRRERCTGTVGRNQGSFPGISASGKFARGPRTEFG